MTGPVLNLSGQRPVIVGAGASGLFLASLLARAGLAPLVLERGPRPGRKLRLTGGGRANLSQQADAEALLAHYRPEARFLWRAFTAWPPERVREQLQRCGIPTHVEAEGRVFPDSQSADDVADRLAQDALAHGAEFRYDCELIGLRQAESGAARWQLALDCSHEGDLRQIEAGTVVLACGGASYPQTGSDGTALGLLNAVDVPVTPFAPALVPLRWCSNSQRRASAQLAGVSLDDVALSIPARKASKRATSRGGLVFTHQGISGPAALNLSGRVAEAGQALVLDLLPNSSLEESADWLAGEAAAGRGRALATTLAERLPQRLVQGLSLISSDWANASDQWPQRTRQLGPRHVRAIAEHLHALPLQPLRPAALEQAMVSRGGVSTRALDPSSFALRKFPGLYVIGELVDLDGDSGGYNLQLAFASAGVVADALLGR